jgi:hypothetical protein
MDDTELDDLLGNPGLQSASLDSAVITKILAANDNDPAYVLGLLVSAMFSRSPEPRTVDPLKLAAIAICEERAKDVLRLRRRWLAEYPELMENIEARRTRRRLSAECPMTSLDPVESTDPLVGEIAKELLELFEGSAPENAADALASFTSLLSKEGAAHTALDGMLAVAEKLAAEGIPLEARDAEAASNFRDATAEVTSTGTGFINSLDTVINTLVGLQAGTHLIELAESMRARIAARLASIQAALDKIDG